MTHEQLQAAQRAALSMGLNINSEQAAAIINAALRAQQAAVPEEWMVGFKLHEVQPALDQGLPRPNLWTETCDGEPHVKAKLWRGLPGCGSFHSSRFWPFYGIDRLTVPAAPQPAATPILVEAVATVVGDEEDGLRLSWLLEGGIAALEHPGTVLLVAQGQLTDDEGSGYVISVSDSREV